MPRWTILYGDSMGGHVVVAGLETHPTLFQGGLAECGVVDGVGLDWVYAYTAAAEMTELLCKRFGYSAIDAYMLCSVCADLRISSIVDRPNWVVSFYFPRVFLE